MKMREVQAFKLGVAACLVIEVVGNVYSHNLMVFGPMVVMIFGIFLEGFTEEAKRDSDRRRKEFFNR